MWKNGRIAKYRRNYIETIDGERSERKEMREKRKKKTMKTETMANLTPGGRDAERRTTTIV